MARFYRNQPELPEVLLAALSSPGEYDPGCLPVDLPCAAGNNG
jgi:hypothetical protein